MPTEFQKLKDVARRVVQNTMAIPANYYASGTADAVLLNVRRTIKNVQTGEMKGTNFNYAERSEEAVHLIFWVEEIAEPARNALVFLATGQAYFVDWVEPADGLTITARVVVARDDQIASHMVAP